MVAKHPLILALLVFTYPAFAATEDPLDKAESRFAKLGDDGIHYKSLGKDAPDKLRKEVKDVMLKTPKYVATSAMKGMADPGIWKDDAIKVPLLVIVTKSRQWNGYEKHVRKLAPKAEYRVIDDAGHFLMLEKPDAFNKELASFLKEQKLFAIGR